MVFLNSDIKVKEGHEDLAHQTRGRPHSRRKMLLWLVLNWLTKKNQLMATGVRGTNKNRRLTGGWNQTLVNITRHVTC